MNRKYLDELYRKLFVIKKEREDLAGISTFPDDGCAFNVHVANSNNLAIQEALINEIIDDYIECHSS